MRKLENEVNANNTTKGNEREENERMRKLGNLLIKKGKAIKNHR